MSTAEKALPEEVYFLASFSKESHLLKELLLKRRRYF